MRRVLHLPRGTAALPGVTAWLVCVRVCVRGWAGGRVGVCVGGCVGRRRMRLTLRCCSVNARTRQAVGQPGSQRETSGSVGCVAGAPCEPAGSRTAPDAAQFMV
jgi:hypothetical protein